MGSEIMYSCIVSSTCEESDIMCTLLAKKF